jgi:PAS domain S-box-containing protein
MTAVPLDMYRLLVETVDQYAIFLLDPTGHVLTWSRGAERLKGYKEDEILGEHFSRFYPPEEVQAKKPQLALAAAAADGRLEDEGWRVRKDGTRFWANVVMTALHDEKTGELVAFAKVTRDLTERRRMEQRLRDEQTQRATLEASAERARMLSALGEALGGSLEVGERLQRIARFAVRWLADWCIVDLRKEDGTVEQLATAHADPARDEVVKRVRIELPPEAMDGHPVTQVLATGHPLLVPEVPAAIMATMPPSVTALDPRSYIVVPLVVRGRLIGSLTLVRSSPDRRYGPPDLDVAEDVGQRAGLALENARLYRAETVAQTRLRLLADAGSTLAASLDYETTLQSLAQLVVPAMGDWCTIFMATPEGGVRNLVVAHSDPTKVEWARTLGARYPISGDPQEGIEAVLRTGKPQRYETITDEMLRMAAKNREQLAILRDVGLTSVILVPIPANERTVGVLTLVAAESGRHYDVEDERLAVELGRRAGIAVEHALLYRGARKAMMEAREAVEARDQFISIASHELRTPLQTLHLLLDAQDRLLRKGVLGPEQLARLGQKVENASTQTGRLQRLVDDLLDVSRIRAGRIPLQPEPVDLEALSRQVIERMEDQLEEAGCRVTVAADAPTTGSWDRLRLEQVLANLLSNAMKYGRGKPIEVNVSREDGTARVAVRDHGIGIAAHDHARIFDRFERAVSGRNFGGLGLGLWITREILHFMGGSIAVDSEPGAGSTFIVELPIEPVAEAADQTTQHTREPVAEDPHPHS